MLSEGCCWEQNTKGGKDAQHALAERCHLVERGHFPGWLMAELLAGRRRGIV